MLRLIVILFLLSSSPSFGEAPLSSTPSEDTEVVREIEQVNSQVTAGMNSKAPCGEQDLRSLSEKEELALVNALLTYCHQAIPDVEDAKRLARVTLNQIKAHPPQAPNEKQCPIKKCIPEGLCLTTLHDNKQFIDFPEKCHTDAGQTKTLRTTYDPRNREVLAALSMKADLAVPSEAAEFNAEKRTTEIRKQLEKTGEFVPPPVAESICQEGSKVTLTQYVQMQNGSLAKPHTITPKWNTVFSDLFSQVKHLHDIGYFHRDIHRGNVLLKEGRARLDDFGLARKSGEGLGKVNYHLLGSWPPEVLSARNNHSDNLLANTDYVNSAQLIYKEYAHQDDPMYQVWTKFFHEELQPLIKTRNSLLAQLSNKTNVYNLSKSPVVEKELNQLKIQLEPVQKAIEIKVRRNQSEQRKEYAKFKESFHVMNPDPGIQEVVRLLDPDFLFKNQDRRYDPKKVIAQMKIHAHLRKVQDLKKQETKQLKREEKKRLKNAENPPEPKTDQQPEEAEPFKMGDPSKGYI